MTMSYVYDTREITHGDAYAAFAQVAESTMTPGTLDTTKVPQSFTGLRAVSFETTQEQNKYYADNILHFTINGVKTIEGTITCYQFPKAFTTGYLGFKESTNGSLIDTGTFAPFIFQYIETVETATGGNQRLLTIYYNLKATAPTASTATDEDTVTPKEFTINCTAAPQSLVMDQDNQPVTMMQVRGSDADSNALIDLAYSQIILPSTIITP